MQTDERVLELVQVAIDEGRIEDARSLLRPLMERNLVDAYYFASRVAYSQEQALEFLRYAVLLDPQNVPAREQLKTLETLYLSEEQAIVPVQESPEANSRTNKRIKQTAQLFRKYGWKQISRDNESAHLTRRRTMSAVSAFIIGLCFNLPGLFLSLFLLLSAEKLHLFIEADENDILLTSTKGEQLISRPEQAIITIEKFRGVSLLQGLLWCFLGLVLGSIIFYFLIWQTQQNFLTIIDSIQATITAEAPRQRF